MATGASNGRGRGERCRAVERRSLVATKAAYRHVETQRESHPQCTLRQIGGLIRSATRTRSACVGKSRVRRVGGTRGSGASVLTMDFDARGRAEGRLEHAEQTELAAARSDLTGTALDGPDEEGGHDDTRAEAAPDTDRAGLLREADELAGSASFSALACPDQPRTELSARALVDTTELSTIRAVSTVGRRTRVSAGWESTAAATPCIGEPRTKLNLAHSDNTTAKGQCGVAEGSIVGDRFGAELLLGHLVHLLRLLATCS